jgi:C4-dicarboxylate-specific signal transduction histidine kinase
VLPRKDHDGEQGLGVVDRTHEPVDPNETTREAIALSLSRLQRTPVILRSELANDIPLVTGDSLQLRHVIRSLLINAFDAMNLVDDRSRKLVIRTERGEDGRVRLIVRDVGAGVEAQAVDKLFEPFYTTKSGGIGIGLSVGRTIIESRHGRIWAAPNDGPGDKFSFPTPGGPKVARFGRVLPRMRSKPRGICDGRAFTRVGRR